MSRSIKGVMPAPAEQVIEKARHVAEKNSVDFQGDLESGNFSGKGYVGHYTVDGEHLTLTITKKPLLVPWKAVELVLHKMFDYKEE